LDLHLLLVEKLLVPDVLDLLFLVKLLAGEVQTRVKRSGVANRMHHCFTRNPSEIPSTRMREEESGEYHVVGCLATISLSPVLSRGSFLGDHEFLPRRLPASLLLFAVDLHALLDRSSNRRRKLPPWTVICQLEQGLFVALLGLPRPLALAAATITARLTLSPASSSSSFYSSVPTSPQSQVKQRRSHPMANHRKGVDPPVVNDLVGATNQRFPLSVPHRHAGKGNLKGKEEDRKRRPHPPPS
jgi:hypothetical protein